MDRLGIKPSKYLSYFSNEYVKLRESIKLVGDIIIVERVEFPEKKRGGLFLVDSKKTQSHGLTSELPNFYRVLAVGEGYYDEETSKDVPLEVAPGDVVLVSNASVKVWSTFPIVEAVDADTIGMTRFGDVQWHWKSEESFIRFLGEFNQGTKEKVEPGGSI